jgi:hypothetical protein
MSLGITGFGNKIQENLKWRKFETEIIDLETECYVGGNLVQRNILRRFHCTLTP